MRRRRDASLSATQLEGERDGGGLGMTMLISLFLKLVRDWGQK